MTKIGLIWNLPNPEMEKIIDNVAPKVIRTKWNMTAVMNSKQHVTTQVLQTNSSQHEPNIPR